MTLKTKSNIFFLVLFALMVAALLFLCHISRAEADVMYAFGGTAAKDGLITRLSDLYDCPGEWTTSTVYETGQVATCGTYLDVGYEFQYIERGFLAFNTSTLSGKTVLSATLKVIVHDKYNFDWNTDVGIDVGHDCISSSLAVIDTSCFVTPDMTIPWAQLPAKHDTLSIIWHPDWVSTTGSTEFYTRAPQEINFCGGTARNDVQFYTQEVATPGYRPRLYVTVADDPTPPSGPTHCVSSYSAVQKQVNNASPKKLHIGKRGQGLFKIQNTT